jgi:hypothetical protein
MNEGWDGKYNGEEQPAETYAYTAEGISFFGKEVKIQGYVTLIR